MKKFLATILGFMAILTLVACGGNTVDDSTSEKYISKAEEVVSLLNELNYSTFAAQTRQVYLDIVR
ncbi:hypothetical protein DTX79_11225 [Bacilli bacterium]|nr:hypothetical protein DTX79_11225 [Bacilli bacterium]